MRASLQPNERKTIENLFSSGLSVTKIARETRHSRETVAIHLENAGLRDRPQGNGTMPGNWPRGLACYPNAFSPAWYKKNNDVFVKAMSAVYVEPEEAAKKIAAQKAAQAAAHMQNVLSKFKARTLRLGKRMPKPHEKVFEMVEHCGGPVRDSLLAKKKSRYCVRWRAIAARVLREKHGYSLVEIGRVLKRDHSTVVNLLSHEKMLRDNGVKVNEGDLERFMEDLNLVRAMS